MKNQFKVFLFAGFAAFLGLAAPRAGAAPILYGATGTGGGTGTLVTIDTATGNYTVIGSLNDAQDTNYRITGLAFHPTTGVLYGSIARSSFSVGSLVTIDPLTAAVTLVGSFGMGTQTMADLTFSALGVLYGWLEPGDDDLYTIDLTTGAATWVGESGLSTYGAGLAATPGGPIYLAGSGADGTLWTIDPGTGAATAGSSLNGGPSDGEGLPVPALAFSPGAAEIPEPSSLSLLVLGGLR